jgi:hypothetical protein
MTRILHIPISPKIRDDLSSKLDSSSQFDLSLSRPKQKIFFPGYYNEGDNGDYLNFKCHIKDDRNSDPLQAPHPLLDYVWHVPFLGMSDNASHA